MHFTSIEIICRPCGKCFEIERRLKEAIRSFERAHKQEFRHQFRKSMDLRRAQRYGANVSQAPFLIVNGLLKLSGSRAMANSALIKEILFKEAYVSAIN